MFVFVIILCVLILIGLKLDFRSFHDCLSFPQTTPVRGICIFAIVLQHLYQESREVSLFATLFTGLGFLMVSLFFFYSGYGLMVSYQSKSLYRKTFFTKRILSILLPYIFFIGLYWIAQYLRTGNLYTPAHVFLSLFNGSPIVFDSWYILVILFFYFSFYISLFLFDKKYIAILWSSLFSCILWIALCCVRRFDSYWYNTCFCIPFGMLIAIFKDNFLQIAKKRYGGYLFVSVVAFTFSTGATLLLRNIEWLKSIFVAITALLFITVILLVMMKCSTKNKLWYFLSQISLELYLFHRLALRFFRGPHMYIENNLLYGVAVLATSIPIAYLLHLLFSKIGLLSVSFKKKKSE